MTNVVDKILIVIDNHTQVRKATSFIKCMYVVVLHNTYLSTWHNFHSSYMQDDVQCLIGV